MGDEKPDVDAPGLLGWIVNLFGFSTREKRRVYALLGVLAMGGAVLWLLGVFAFIGFPPRFAYADDLAKTNANVAALSASVASMVSAQNQSLALNLATEIRAQVKLRCEPQKPDIRVLIDSSIDNLQARYLALTTRRYHEPGCDSK